MVAFAVICEITVNFILLIIFHTEESNLISALSYFMNFGPEKESQNNRVVEVGRDIWRSSSPSRVRQSRFFRAVSSQVLNIVKDEDCNLSGSDRISCISFCACCLLSCHLTQLRRAWLCLLYSPLPPSAGIYKL